MLVKSYCSYGFSISFYDALIRAIKRIIINLKNYKLSSTEDLAIAKIDTKKAIENLFIEFYVKVNFNPESNFDLSEENIVYDLLSTLDDLTYVVNRLVDLLSLYTNRRSEMVKLSKDISEFILT